MDVDRLFDSAADIFGGDTLALQREDGGLMSTSLRFQIGAPANATVDLFSGKIIRTILYAGVAMALVSSGGFVEHAFAQGKTGKQTDKPSSENWRAFFSERPSVILTPPPSPPDKVPATPCATEHQRQELIRLAKNWRGYYSAWKGEQKRINDLEDNIEKLSDRALSIIDSGAASTNQAASIELASLLASVKEAKYRLDEAKRGADGDFTIVENISTAYESLLDSIPKDCTPPPQTSPQQPPANPPPQQQPTPPPNGGPGGSHRFGSRPSVVMGPGGYVGVGGGALATICNDVKVTGVKTHDADDTNDAGGVDFCATAGFRASVYGGYDWRLGSGWIAGIEADVGYATNNTTGGIPGVSTAPGDSFSMREDWDGSLRARFGYLVTPNTLVYGTAGLALQHISATVTCSSATPFPCGRFGPVTAFTATNAPVLVGGTIGVGAEYAITGNLRLRAEYRFSDYGTSNATFGNPANIAISTATQLRTNTALLGLTYAFGPPPATSPPPLIAK